MNRIEKLVFNTEKSNLKFVYFENGTQLVEMFKQIITPFLNEKLYEYNLDLPEEKNCGSKQLQIVNIKTCIDLSLT